MRNPIPVAITVFGILLIFRICETAQAAYLPESIGLEAAILKSDAIAVCKVKSIYPDPEGIVKGGPTTASSLGDLIRSTAMQPASKYELDLLENIKGTLPSSFGLHLPFISAHYYGHTEFGVRAESYCIVILSKSPNGIWLAVDETMPLIPLRDKPVFSNIPGLDVKTRVFKHLIAGLSDPVLRRLYTYLLAGVRDNQVLEACKKYTADDDMHVRSNVLKCMALNQDTSAISLIADFEKRSKKSWCADALNKYQTPSAVPMLNEVLDTGPEYSRLNASLALRRLADHSSIPFLMKAMSADDPQHVVAFEAYATLHDLFGPGAGELMSCDYFLQHRNLEIEKLKSWSQSHAITIYRSATTQDMKAN